MLETADEDLIGFFDELYSETNPNTKSNKTNENNKKKLVSLCYFLASINNKYINGLKANIGSYLQTAGASSSSIDTLNNLGFSVTRKTLDQKKLLVADEYQETVNNYCLQNIEKMFFLNIDDYHNIYHRNQPTLLQTHNIFHFNINETFMSKLNKSYYKQNEIWKQFLIEDSYENRIELFTVHNYDGRIQYNRQVNIRRTITLRIDKGAESGIPLEILSLIPLIGPLHISLNKKKILSQKPKQTTINLILNLTFQGWKKIRNVIIKRFGNSKDAEYRMMIDLLDNSIPLTLDIYATLFRSGFFEGYLESIVRIWILFQRLRRHNYNKAPLIFLSDDNLPIFNDYFIENFHSSIRNQTAESNSAQQIIQKAKIIDNTKTKPSDNKFYDAENCLLSDNNLSLLSDDIVLTCRHAYHKQCLNLLKDNCEHCFSYLSSNIEKKIISLKKRLLTPLKDNEKPLIEDENNDLNEDIDNKN
ncbi:hypothetical protein RhiirA4_454836 [Rhizophagus irregularis]|uniref:Uncharacterized protein n=1 Tax=Rhizophagus irregularis TaxID=588596 RepID=A0A2I1G3T1_9GLOM|nr:hypothetical protein RhiirA4_454836 [Rhizophagus irregularis]